MQSDRSAALSWEDVDALAAEVVAYGARVGLPYVAAQSDLGDPVPMADRDGRAYAERMPWVCANDTYWRNRSLALRSSFLHAARIFAEPIWYADGRLGSWRATGLLEAIDCSRVTEEFGFTGALIAPVHLAGGQVGTVLWVATQPVDMPAIFAEWAEPLFALAYRLLAAHTELTMRRVRTPPGQLSAREAQCVRWAAAGKTNAEIGTILSLSVSTVRFHLRNAAEKLGATTRARMIQIATGHGFLGPHA
ncbi:LuxR family transcriptional regulator [Sphingomonas sp. ABOLG]|jgi:DNA-binding CsgD family transcriptional regulator|uniref:helix-turn-helix transcriptional regulator n=1 Tax=unclassified Sphingomonas TaxID=196159 RepID=UPI000622AEE7|nr:MULTISPECIES: LuxR C-terminal-related transcriptional regulator [unclassified Sphingomonas]KKI17854.1 LuxR family transcriptional regulator [Sphingomonas sp. Ag1]RSV16936.1 LuxR family transcriptional regulator [Sphingomonas sp. ABOLG]